LVVNRTIQFEGKRPEKDQRTQQLVREDSTWWVVLPDETLKLSHNLRNSRQRQRGSP
jgi:hypothetical protein